MPVTEEFKGEWAEKYWAMVQPFYSRIHQSLSDEDLFKQLWIERRQFQTDLFWAARHVLGYDLADAYYCADHKGSQSGEPGNCPLCGKELVAYWNQAEGELYPKGSSPHRMITDFFVHKDPDKPWWDQDSIRHRFMMAPRGGFKSSVDQADCVQWIVCFPDIRILALSASDTYSTDFVEAVAKHFVRLEREGSKKKDEREILNLTWFQCLFIEHTRSSLTRRAEGEFTTAARTSDFRGIEPSIYAFGLKSNKSGYHFEIGKFDDCVSDANSGPSATPETRQIVGETIRLAGGLLMPNGYRDTIGTPYHEQDAYTPMVATAELNPEDLKFLRRPCWQVKDSAILKPEIERTEEDYDLFFPIDGQGRPQQTFAFLRATKREADRTNSSFFACQYLCEPKSVRKIKFNDHLIRSHIIQPEGYQTFPQLYTAVSVWDFAYSKTKTNRRDYSVGAVGWFDVYGRLFVKELVRGQWGKYELAKMVAEQAARWRVTGIYIEGSNGADFLETDIRTELLKTHYVDCTLEWFPVDVSSGAKNTRAELLEGMLVNNKLFFSKEIEILEDMVSEFVKFDPTVASRHDDIVDSIAHLARFAPSAEEMPATEKEVQSEMYRLLQTKLQMEMIFGDRDPAPQSSEKPQSLPMDIFDIPYSGYQYEWTRPN